MPSALSETIRACRICDGADLQRILDLGAQPPANSLRRDAAEALPAIPLVLCRCAACGTIQLTETVSPAYLFRDYVWVTGTSRTAQEYSRLFCERLVARSRPGRLRVVEIASNDGTFLQRFRERGDAVLGIDPAHNIAQLAEAAGIPTIAEFFGLAVARRVVDGHGPADIVFARNVLPHVANAPDVVAGMAHCLAASGVGAVEFHRADVILEQLHYDSIYHEHLFYHSLHSIGALLGRYGLHSFDVTESPISGGSFVVYFSKTARDATVAYKAALSHERALGVADEGPWQKFARRCEQHRRALRGLIQAKKHDGKRLIGYGASARSATLLNFCGIDHRHLDAVADRSQMKHDRYAPGSDLPIVPPDKAFAGRPDAVLLLAWNFRDEILADIKAEQRWAGDVIVPLPGDPNVVAVR